MGFLLSQELKHFSNKKLWIGIHGDVLLAG